MPRPIEPISSSVSVECVCVDPNWVGEIWPHVAPLLRAAVTHTNLDRFGEIERDVLSGRSLLWLAWSDHVEAAATTILTETDVVRVCFAHRLRRPQHEALAAAARDHRSLCGAEGCDRLRLFGRKGWQRVLENYRVTNIILERTL